MWVIVGGAIASCGQMWSWHRRIISWEAETLSSSAQETAPGVFFWTSSATYSWVPLLEAPLSQLPLHLRKTKFSLLVFQYNLSVSFLFTKVEVIFHDLHIYLMDARFLHPAQFILCCCNRMPHVG